MEHHGEDSEAFVRKVVDTAGGGGVEVVFDGDVRCELSVCEAQGDHG